MTAIRRNIWLNLAIDVFSFAEACFPEAGWKQLDFIKLSGACKLRRIFTMLGPPYDDEFDDEVAGPELFSALDSLAAVDSRGVYGSGSFCSLP